MKVLHIRIYIRSWKVCWELKLRLKRGLAEIQKDISQLFVEVVSSNKCFVGYLEFNCEGSFSSWMYFFRMWFTWLNEMHEGQFFISVTLGAADLQNPATFSLFISWFYSVFPNRCCWRRRDAANKIELLIPSSNSKKFLLQWCLFDSQLRRAWFQRFPAIG